MEKLSDWFWYAITAQYTEDRSIKRFYLGMSFLFLATHTWIFGLLFLGFIYQPNGNLSIDWVVIWIGGLNMIGWFVSFIAIRIIRKDLQKERR